MALMVWDNSFSVNVKEIDAQHQKLIALINDLHDAMKTGKAKDVLGKILSDLTDYTVYHFGNEERLSRRTAIRRPPRTRRSTTL